MSTYLPLRAPFLPYVSVPPSHRSCDYQLSKLAVGEEMTKQGAEVRAGSWLGNLDRRASNLTLEFIWVVHDL